MKKIAVVTGASAGMGYDFVTKLSKKRKKYDEIWLIARRKDRLDEIVSKFPEQQFKVLDLDLSKEESLKMYADELYNANSKIMLLINNAGYGKMGEFCELSFDSQVGMIDVNIKALTAITHISLKHMGKGSRIINMASAAAFVPQPYFTVYAASKSYVLSFSRALRRELKPLGIKVLTVCPGPVETEFFEVASTTGEPKIYKKLMTEKSENVVVQAFKDLKEDKDLSVYGIKMKIFRVITKSLPHSFIMRFIKG